MSALLELDFNHVQSQEVELSVRFVKSLIEAGADRELFNKISRLEIEGEIILPKTWEDSETGEEIHYLVWRASRSSFVLRGEGGYSAVHVDDKNLTSDIHSPWETAAQLFIFCGGDSAEAVRLEKGSEMILAGGNMVRRVQHGWHLYRVEGERGFVAGQATLPQELGRKEFSEMFRGSWSSWKRLFARRVRHIVDGIIREVKNDRKSIFMKENIMENFRKGYAGFYECRPGIVLPESLAECWELLQELPHKEAVILNRFADGDVKFLKVEKSTSGTWGGLFVGTWRPGGPSFPTEKVFTDPDARRK